MIMLDTKTVARNTRDPTMKATREKKTVPLKVPKTTNPSPAAPGRIGSTEESNFEVCISRARLKSLTEAKVGRDAGRVAVRAGAGGLAADADVARGHAGIVRLHSVEGILDEES